MRRIATGRLYHVLYARRRPIILTIYALIAAASYGFAYLIRFDFEWPPGYTDTFLFTLPLLLVIRLGWHSALRVSAERWRFVGTSDVIHLFLAVTAGSFTFFVAAALIPITPSIPRSVILAEWVLTTYFTAGVWIAYRTSFERLRKRNGGSRRPTRALVVGAGETGNRLAREMRTAATGYEPVGFADDDPSMWGMRVQGVDVLGPCRDLPRLTVEYQVEEIIIAVPSASPARMRAIVDRCEQCNIPFKVLPGIAEVLDGKVSVSQLREVRIEDLLGRAPVELELPEVAEDLDGESVLITGAAGSIGSELARQVALHKPGKLVILDQAETELYYLELELKQKHPHLEIYPVIGDIVDAACVKRVFSRYRPSRVYHAAAYKHVPMMELHPREAIRNNVLGTWRVAEAAGRSGTERFVLVSTDKAVRPANVMGATKRAAEMIVTELQEEFGQTTYSAVRFGNVLGSAGSVIPIFQRQIAAGAPLTVTHPEATRYFMTIPEAVQLILQASLLPAIRGQIAMLEMGEPVRIADLARNLLRLSGVTANNGKRIIFTGLRPGEKLHEELVAPDEGTRTTPIDKIRLVVPANAVLPRICRSIDRTFSENNLEQALESLTDTLSALFPDLRPIDAETSVAGRAEGETAEAGKTA